MAGRLTHTDAPAADPSENREALHELTAGDQLPILLVDDRAENLQTLEAVLAPLGVPLCTVTSGYDALRMVLERDFALILLDVRMPGLDGLETARLIKSRSRSRDVPIVFLTAARDELGDILRGYDVGAVDYVLKPFDAELLRSKAAVFIELERSRRALKRSEALLRGAFEAAPIGKTVLDADRRIVLANPAFVRLLGPVPRDLAGVPILELCHPDDREALSTALDQLSQAGAEPASQVDVGIRLVPGASWPASAGERWVTAVASSIEPEESADPLLLVQWIDLSARRRAEQARAELLVEQSARTHAEAIAERLNTLQALADATDESLPLRELLAELAVRLSELFDAESVEATADGGLPFEETMTVRVVGGHVTSEDEADDADSWQEVPLSAGRTRVGMLRLARAEGAPFSPADRSLLRDAADRAALAIRRVRLREEEHRIAVELQRGLVPNQLPEVSGIELAAHYRPAGVVAEVGGDWYDAFALPGGRIGIVFGDVAGKGIPAASTMGRLRSVTRAFALADDGTRPPGEVLTRLNRFQRAQSEQEMFTVIYAIVDPGSHSVSWASAGHLPPFLREGDEHDYLTRGDGLMGLEDLEYQSLTRAIAPGGILVFYTDGLVERRGESLDDGLERLARAVASGPEEPQQLCDYILAQLLPDELALHDDVTAMILKVL